MSALEDRMESARSVFMAHRQGCRKCQEFQFKTAELHRLCWTGMTLYRAVLTAEDNILKRMTASEKAAYTRQKRRGTPSEMQLWGNS